MRRIGRADCQVDRIERPTCGMAMARVIFDELWPISKEIFKEINARSKVGIAGIGQPQRITQKKVNPLRRYRCVIMKLYHSLSPPNTKKHALGGTQKVLLPQIFR